MKSGVLFWGVKIEYEFVVCSFFFLLRGFIYLLKSKKFNWEISEIWCWVWMGVWWGFLWGKSWVVFVRICRLMINIWWCEWWGVLLMLFFGFWIFFLCYYYFSFFGCCLGDGVRKVLIVEWGRNCDVVVGINEKMELDFGGWLGMFNGYVFIDWSCYFMGW